MEKWLREEAKQKIISFSSTKGKNKKKKKIEAKREGLWPDLETALVRDALEERSRGGVQKNIQTHLTFNR